MQTAANANASRSIKQKREQRLRSDRPPEINVVEDFEEVVEDFEEEGHCVRRTENQRALGTGQHMASTQTLCRDGCALKPQADDVAIFLPSP